MPKYTVYAYRIDDEGGMSICRAEDFEPKKACTEFGFYQREKVGDFDTAEELAALVEINLADAIEWLEEVKEREA